MARRKRSPEENERRAKIRELLQMSGISSMDDIQDLFKETIAEFMENGLEAELDNELGYSKYDYKTRTQITAGTGTAARRCGRVWARWKSQYRGIGKANLNPRY